MLAILKILPLRWWLYIAGALAICFVLWREHHAVKRAHELAIERNQAVADLTAERAARAHERKIAEDASHEFQRTVTALQAARADTPVRTVRLCRGSETRVPAAASAAAGTDARASDRLSQAPGPDPRDRWGDDGPDIGPELYAEADQADTNAAQCNALIQWVRNR